MGEEANIKLVQLVWEHPILYDWKDPGYSRKEKTDLVWENIGKELNEAGKLIYWINNYKYSQHVSAGAGHSLV